MFQDLSRSAANQGFSYEVIAAAAHYDQITFALTNVVQNSGSGFTLFH
jgi:hypothetical protein